MAKKKSIDLGDILNDASFAAEKPETETGFSIQHIDLDSIRPSDKNRYGIRDIEELAAAIEDVGLMHNIVVRETAEAGAYEIISGERRYRAFQMLRDGGKAAYASIPCKVEADNDDAMSELRLLYANSTARELTDYEKTYQAMRTKELLQDLKAQGKKINGRIRDIVAETFNVSGSQISRMEKIHGNLIPEFTDEFKDENIGISAAYDLSLLPQDEQEAALDDYKETGAEAIRAATAKLRPAAQPTPVVPEASEKNDTPEPVTAAPKDEPQQQEPPQAVTEPEEMPKPESLYKRLLTFPDTPLRVSAAQCMGLVELGKQAVQEFCSANMDDREQVVSCATKIETITMIAAEFGLDYQGFEEEIHDIPEYIEKYGSTDKEGAQ